MRLGVVYEPGKANSHYRAIFPMQALERRGHTVVWPSRTFEVPLREFSSCDLVHCYRRIDRIGDLRKLAARGVAISFDNDDNQALSEVGYGDSGPGVKGRLYNNRLFRATVEMARLADLVTTTNEPIARAYRSAGAAEVSVIENRLDSAMFGFGARSRHDGVMLGWVAAHEHELDLERIPIVAALARLLEDHHELRVLTVGVRLPLRSERYEHIPLVPFAELLKVTSRIDVGIAPIADTPFNRSRSDVKLKEYGAGGAMWLASPVGPYVGLGEREGGLLVGDEDWHATIEELLRRPRRRRRLARRSLRWARGEAIDRHASVWERAFLDAIERARGCRASVPAAAAVS